MLFLDVKIIPASVAMRGRLRGGRAGARRDLGKWPLGMGFIWAPLPTAVMVPNSGRGQLAVHSGQPKRGPEVGCIAQPGSRAFQNLPDDGSPNCVILHECPLWRENRPKSVGSSLHLVSYLGTIAASTGERDGWQFGCLQIRQRRYIRGMGAFPPW